MADTALADEEITWERPTTEQRAEAKKRKTRNDQISSLMGDYLLKGYRMLGSTCSTCGAVLMRDRQSRDICIGCEEIDKVNRQESEQTLLKTEGRNTKVGDSVQNLGAVATKCSSGLQAAVASLEQQISFATQQLQNCTTLSIAARCELCQLIERAATAMIAVQKTVTKGDSE